MPRGSTGSSARTANSPGCPTTGCMPRSSAASSRAASGRAGRIRRSRAMRCYGPVPTRRWRASQVMGTGGCWRHGCGREAEADRPDGADRREIRRGEGICRVAHGRLAGPMPIPGPARHRRRSGPGIARFGSSEGPPIVPLEARRSGEPDVPRTLRPGMGRPAVSAARPWAGGDCLLTSRDVPTGSIDASRRAGDRAADPFEPASQGISGPGPSTRARRRPIGGSPRGGVARWRPASDAAGRRRTDAEATGRPSRSSKGRR